MTKPPANKMIKAEPENKKAKPKETKRLDKIIEEIKKGK